MHRERQLYQEKCCQTDELTLLLLVFFRVGLYGQLGMVVLRCLMPLQGWLLSFFTFLGSPITQRPERVVILLQNIREVLQTPTSELYQSPANFVAGKATTCKRWVGFSRSNMSGHI